jgi:hypothetical protein
MPDWSAVETMPDSDSRVSPRTGRSKPNATTDEHYRGIGTTPPGLGVAHAGGRTAAAPVTSIWPAYATIAIWLSGSEARPNLSGAIQHRADPLEGGLELVHRLGGTGQGTCAGQPFDLLA